MRFLLRRMPRRLGMVAVLVAVMVGREGLPVAAKDQPPATVWTLILEFPTGNVNAQVAMTNQGGQLAGTARIAGKRCPFKISGTYTVMDDEDSDDGDSDDGTFTMKWTGQRACAGEVLTLHGTVVDEEITGTFMDTTMSGGPFHFVGTVISNNED